MGAPSDPAVARRTGSPAAGAVAAALLGVAAFRLWCGVCAFTGEEWNEVRLRAAWLVRDGLPLYPGFDAGPATTWIYGPVAPVLMLPATWFSGIEAALLAAAGLSVLLLAGSIAFACLTWPAPAGRRWRPPARLAAVGVSLLLLPEPFLVFLSADTAALACGLVSLACLARAGQSRAWPWLAAAFGGAALFAKWHGAAVLVAGLAWIGLTAGLRPLLQHTLRVGLAVLAGVALVLALAASPRTAWEGLILIPAQLPLIGAEKLAARLELLAPGLGLLLLLPALVAGHQLRHERWRTSGLGLPLAAWIASLPLGVAGMFTYGGHYNSLHGAFFLLPPAAVVLAAGFAGLAGRRRVLAVIAAVLLAGFRAVELAQRPVQPRLQMAREAMAIASGDGRRAWLPWRPLATRLATGRHDHDEDGLLIRQLTGHPPAIPQLHAHLPPAWDSTFLQASGMTWGLAAAMRGPDWTVSQLGGWLILTGRRADSDVGKIPAAPHPPR